MKTKAQINCAAEPRLCFGDIIQSLYFLNPKFHAFSHLLWLYSPVCFELGNPEDRFCGDMALENDD